MTDAEWEQHLVELERLDGWMSRFKKKLGRWWLVTPFQDALRSCLRALSLLIASRLKQAYSGFHAPLRTRAIATSPLSQQVGTAKEGCEWVVQRAEELKLPDFPPFDSVHSIQLPPKLPPLPRVLPLIPVTLQSAVTDASSRLAKPPWQPGESSPTRLHHDRRAWLFTVGGAAFGSAAALAIGATIVAYSGCGCGLSLRRYYYY